MHKSTTSQCLHNFQQPKSKHSQHSAAAIRCVGRHFQINYVRMCTGSLVSRPQFWLRTRLARVSMSMYDKTLRNPTCVVINKRSWVQTACMWLRAWTYLNNYSIVSTISRYRVVIKVARACVRVCVHACVRACVCV